MSRQIKAYLCKLDYQVSKRSLAVNTRDNLHLSLGVTLHVDNVNILGQLDTSVGGDGRSFNGDPVGIVEEGVVQGRLPPGSSSTLGR